MRIEGIAWLVLVCASACAADKWRWPDARLDGKVRFDDARAGAHGAPSKRDFQTSKNTRFIATQSEEQQFEQPTNTEGFYNRPPGAGRYPVQVESYREPYRVDPDSVYNVKKTSPQPHARDGTVNIGEYCKCMSSPECSVSVDSAKACGEGKYLCCFKRSNKKQHHKTEYFNEVEDERLTLLPGDGERAGPFPPPPFNAVNGGFGPGHAHDDPLPAQGPPANNLRKPVLIGPGGPTGVVGPAKHNQGVLVGPQGPTGIIGPIKKNIGSGGINGQSHSNPGVLVGPGGPTGIIGPTQLNEGVLVGPGGPTGIIGLTQQNPHILRGTDGTSGNLVTSFHNKGILVGAGGPTGTIGPTYHTQEAAIRPEGGTGIIATGQQNQGILFGPDVPTGLVGPANRGYYFDSIRQDNGASESAQRGILVGPGGPTGIIGPGYGRRPVLVGPGGPPGVVGPYGRSRPAVLVGPGGPTGIIGPSRRPYYGK